MVRRHSVAVRPGGAVTAARVPVLRRRGLAVASSLALMVAACSDGGGADPTTVTTSSPTVVSTSTTSPGPTTSAATDPAGVLFVPSDRPLDPDPLAVRQRAVKIDLDVLLDDRGRPREVERVVLNLFPDTTFVGLITGIDDYSGGFTWVGTLEGHEVSSLTMVWVAGTFAANAATPEGIFEVSWAGGGVYQVMEIDQGAFPGEG